MRTSRGTSGGEPRGRVRPRGNSGSTVLNRHCRSTKPSKRSPRSWIDAAAEVAAARRAALVPEDVVDERVQVARVRGEVVEAVRREARSPKPRRSGTITSKPAAASGSMLRHQIRIVSGQPWTSSSGYAADALAHVGELDAVAHLGALRREGPGAERRRRARGVGGGRSASGAPSGRAGPEVVACRRMSQASAGIPEVSFDERAILAEARPRAGLDDFGDDSFREPLRLHARGPRRRGEAQRDRPRRAARAHRRPAREPPALEDCVARHPEILDEEIRRPIVIAGLPRTGTTMLHRLLASDAGHLRRATGGSAASLRRSPARDWREADPRIADAEAEVEQILASAPELAAIHPWDAEGRRGDHAHRVHLPELDAPESTHDVPELRRLGDAART